MSVKNLLITVVVVIVVIFCVVRVVVGRYTVGEGLLAAGFTVIFGAVFAVFGFGGDGGGWLGGDGGGWFGGDGGDGGGGGGDGGG